MSEAKPPRPKNGKRKHREDLLDEALDESFPASDPPAITSPHRHPGDADDQTSSTRGFA
jgi:hypothetical protein